MFVELLLESLLSHDIYTVIKYSSLYYSSEVCCYGKCGTILEKIKIISSFAVLLLRNIRRLFIGIDTSGLKLSILFFLILYRQRKSI